MKCKNLKSAVVWFQLLPALALGAPSLAHATTDVKCPPGYSLHGLSCAPDNGAAVNRSPAVTTPPAAPAPASAASSANTQTAAPAQAAGSGEIRQSHPVDEEAVTPREYAKDMSLDELKSTFPSFALEANGNGSNQTINVRGILFNDCLKRPGANFSVANSANTPNDSDLAAHLGFRFSDPNGVVRQCMAEKRAEGFRCDDSKADHRCIKLSQVLNPLHLNGAMKDGDIGIVHSDPNVDGPAAFDPSGITHLSTATIIANRQAKEQSARDARLELDKNIVAHCRNNDDDLAQAKTAVDEFCNMTGLDDKQCTQLNKKFDLNVKKNDQKKLADFQGRIKDVDVKDKDAINSIADDLDQYAQDAQDGDDDKKAKNSSREVANLYFALVDHVVSSQDADKSSFVEGLALLKRMKEIPGLSKADKQKIAGYPKQIAQLEKAYEVKALTNAARSGQIDQQTFYNQYMALMNSLGQDVMANCQTANNMSGIPASCQTSMQMLNGARNLPSIYSQAQQQQYNFQMSINQSIMSSMYPQQQQSTMGGTNGMYGMNAGMNTSGMMSGAGTMPQIVGGTAISGPQWR